MPQWRAIEPQRHWRTSFADHRAHADFKGSAQAPPIARTPILKALGRTVAAAVPARLPA
jgi:hypothetical protein